MEIISSKQFILLTLATSILLTSNIFCEDELLMSNLHREENYDKYSVPRGTQKGEKERSLHVQESKDRKPKNVIKMSTPTANRMPHLAANLPLRFGRTTKEERHPGRTANLPLRFGRNMEANMWRHVPNLPQRLGSDTKTPRGSLRLSMHSPCTSELLHPNICQSQAIHNPDKKQSRRLIFKKIDGTKGKQEHCELRQPGPKDEAGLGP